MKPDPMIKCPCCRGSGLITERSPVPLTAMQFQIWNLVRRADGISAADLTRTVYAHHHGGRPATAGRSICVTVHHANKRLARVNQKIVSSMGRGAVYRLEYLDETK
jgi:hypothetical protein